VICRQNVRQPHEGDQVAKCLRRVREPNAAASASSRKLQTGERVDGDRIGRNTGDVAASDCSALGQERADPRAESSEVRACDRAADGEGDLIRPGCGHRS
jgi:hypothetical protein